MAERSVSGQDWHGDQVIQVILQEEDSEDLDQEDYVETQSSGDESNAEYQYSGDINIWNKLWSSIRSFVRINLLNI